MNMTGITIITLKPGEQRIINTPGVLYIKYHNRLKQKVEIKVYAEETQESRGMIEEKCGECGSDTLKPNG
jgi:hypothetical protein